MLGDDSNHGSPSPRLVLLLSSLSQSPPIVPPHQPTRISACTKNGALDVECIFMSEAGTPGGAADWTVNDIEVDGRSQLARKDLPGALFGSKGIAVGPRASTAFMLKGFTPVERGRELTLVVTYVGPLPEGAYFFASAVGRRPPQRPTVLPIASKLPLLPATKTTITARVENAPLEIDRIQIDEGPDWVVDDLRVDGQTLLLQEGGLPGDLFAIGAIDAFVRNDICPAGGTIELDVSYIGLAANGATFTARLEGTVVRDDHNVPPPDLNVIVETSGQGPGDAIIATCDWRAPATDDSSP